MLAEIPDALSVVFILAQLNISGQLSHSYSYRCSDVELHLIRLKWQFTSPW